MVYWRSPGLRFTTFLIVLLFGPATIRCEMAPIRLSVDKQLGFPPFTTTATVSIPKHADNREACLVVTLDGVPSSSCWPLNGAHDTVQFQRTMKRLGPGRHHFVATLRRSSGWFHSDPVIVSVIE